MRQEKHIFCRDKKNYLVYMSSFNLFVPGFSELNLFNEVCQYPLATSVTCK